VLKNALQRIVRIILLSQKVGGNVRGKRFLPFFSLSELITAENPSPTLLPFVFPDQAIPSVPSPGFSLPWLYQVFCERDHPVGAG
jgi:hypothetical protein